MFSCINYSFHKEPVRVNQSKLALEITKLISLWIPRNERNMFSVQNINSISYNFRKNQSELLRRLLWKNSLILNLNQKYAFLLKYSLHKVPVRLNKSKLAHGIATKEIMDFKVKKKILSIKIDAENFKRRIQWIWI